MAIIIELQPTDMSFWAPGTRHYRSVDGTNLAVESMTDSVPGDIDIPAIDGAVDEIIKITTGDSMPVHQVLRPTVVFACTEDGFAVDMTPLQTYPPGTTYDAALTEMGYEVVA